MIQKADVVLIATVLKSNNFSPQSMAYMLCGNMDRGAPEYQLEAAIR